MLLDSFNPLRRLAVGLSAAMAFGIAWAEAPATTHAVQDPHYGDTLFHFFQANHFNAVTTLMVSQQFDRVSHHADEAEVLRGGMLLSYGLHREAGEIFAQLIDKGAAPPVRDRAWFYLAKIRHQRGLPTDAEAALARIENNLPPELQQERGLLQANLMMARGDFSGAAATLGAMDVKSPGARYVRFNLGIALVKAGEAVRGTAVLDELGRASAENEEYRSLRDRANVALGFMALTDNQPKAARTYLERVRLKGLHANKALLGFGWAASALKDPKLALVPWLELAQRDVSDSAALEAQIAVPYAYAELGAPRQSLVRYTEAISAFSREANGLDESIAAIRSGKLVDAMVERNASDAMGWFQGIDALPDMPHAAHLASVFAQHEFQEAFKNYRDLRFLSKNLEEWRDKLGVFDDMLATRRKAFADRLPQVRERAGGIGLGGLQKRGDAVAAEVSRAEAAPDGAAFADAKQVDLLERVARVQAALKDAGAGAELDALRERLRLASGALSWQLAQHQGTRAWQAKKELVIIDDQFTQARQRDAALAQAQRDEPVRFDAFGKRIAALAPLLNAAIPRVAALSKEQQGAVQEIAVAELTRQKERLAVYATQARFAVAQLYDRGQGLANNDGSSLSSIKGDDHAAKP